MADSNPPDPLARGGRLRLFSLIAATFFMVSGGPYGIEDTLGGAGYLGALLILSIVPFVWSLPTTLMIGELASALAEGGFYVWVRQAFGPFWVTRRRGSRWLPASSTWPSIPRCPSSTSGGCFLHGRPAAAQLCGR